MVIFDLICDSGHQFEGWFKNNDDFEAQQSNGLLLCPMCDSEHVNKKLAAPKLGRKSNTQPSLPATQEILSGKGSEKAYAQLQKMLGKVHEFIDQNFEDVGNKFADEAISMHRGDKQQAAIRGTATQDQLAKLEDEGVQAMPLPPRPIDKKKIN